MELVRLNNFEQEMSLALALVSDILVHEAHVLHEIYSFVYK